MLQTFTFQNTIISYADYGSGQPIVLLHGFGEDGTIWQHQIELLCTVGRVVVPDLPGSGMSGLLPQLTKTPITITDYANCVYALVQQLQLHNIILLGHSMGGYITLAFAEKYGSLLKAFGLLHSTAFADSPEKKEVRKRGIEMIQQYGAFPFLKNTLPNLFADKYNKEHLEKVNELIDRGKQFTTEALTQYYTAMMNRPDRTLVLQNSKVPVLFIAGDQDVAAPLPDLLQQVHLPNISHFYVLPQNGHMGMWEHADVFNSHLLNFIGAL